jgi:hypothetical protein
LAGRNDSRSPMSTDDGDDEGSADIHQNTNVDDFPSIVRAFLRRVRFVVIYVFSRRRQFCLPMTRNV